MTHPVNFGIFFAFSAKNMPKLDNIHPLLQRYRTAGAYSYLMRLPYILLVFRFLF